MEVDSNLVHGGHKQKRKRLAPVIRLWLLRVLVPLGGCREWLSPSSYQTPSDAIVQVLRLSKSCFNEYDEVDKPAVRRGLRQLHVKAEQQASRVRLPRWLEVNCARIAVLIGIGDVEKWILAFAILLHQEPLLQEISDLLGEVDHPRMIRILAVLLDLPDADIRRALAPTAALAQSGLLKIKSLIADLPMHYSLELLNQGFADRMMSAANDPMILLRDTIMPTPAAELALADYVHVPSVQQIVLPLLRHALNSGQRGVNVLLHGQPGTGKTQLTRVLAKAVKARLFEVSGEDDEGDPIDGEKRLRAFRAALCVVSRSKTLLVFDEAEDVFSCGDYYFGSRGPAQKSKSWVNRTLENNPVPCLWITNSIHGVDPAFIRRFDVVQELPIPTCRQRTRMIENVCGTLATPALVRRLAGAESLAPAVVTRAASVARTVCADSMQEATSAVIATLVENTLTAQGHAALPKQVTSTPSGPYDPACVNVATDLQALVQGIAHTRTARMCLYGPPGTGKTAFAHYLAESLDRPLYIRRVSDLLGPYVGQSEQNIAAAFRQASEDAAVFLLDEVDSFLQDRRAADHSWEVTQVNEMLAGIEAFNGVLLAATNRMDSLDPAVLRRFDLKLPFDYLRAEQAWRLLQRCAAELGLPEPDAAHERSIAGLRTLTPGDFATVSRQARFQPFPDTAALCEALAAECAAKTDTPRRSIGFV